MASERVVKDRQHFCPQMTCRAVVPHRWRPSPEAGPHWRCSECGEANHDLDAWLPGKAMDDERAWPLPKLLLGEDGVGWFRYAPTRAVWLSRGSLLVWTDADGLDHGAIQRADQRDVQYAIRRLMEDEPVRTGGE